MPDSKSFQKKKKKKKKKEKEKPKPTGDLTDPSRPSQNEGVKAKVTRGERVGAQVPRGTTFEKQKFNFRGNEVSREEFEQQKRKLGTTAPGQLEPKNIQPQESGITETQVEGERDFTTGERIRSFLLGPETNEKGELIDVRTGEPFIDPNTNSTTKLHAGVVPIGPGAGAGAIGADLGVSFGPTASRIFEGIGRASELVLSSTGKHTLATLAGSSGIMTWLASDNFLSGISIYTRDIRNAVKFEGLDPDIALEKIDEGIERAEMARKFINTQTTVNPLLWPFRNLINANADNAILIMEENRRLLTGEQPEDLNTT